MVYFRRRLPESAINDCNERIVHHGLNVIRSAESQDDGDGDNDGDLTNSDQPVKPGSENTCSNQEPLLIDATCVPSETRYPTDLSLLNEAR